MKSARTQATIEKGFLKIGLAMSRDFAGLMCNINDYIMHMHNSLDSPGYIAPEFRTEKVLYNAPGRTESFLAFHAISHLDDPYVGPYLLGLRLDEPFFSWLFPLLLCLLRGHLLPPSP